ncbi:MAG: sulfur reduction protein DsrE [Actinomycetota bacterium]|nr:sulfur reduction protein DsrE [Actinomycetota bacterium]
MAATTSYVLIETRDPFESADVESLFELAGRLGATADVSVYLVENGVLPVRATSSAAPAITALAARATVVADDFSLRQRAIGAGDLAPGVAPASIEHLVELITTPGCKAMWH